MNFSDKLNEYMKTVGCNAKELSEASGISQATVSRYRNIKKNASVPVSQITALANGLCKLSGGKLEYKAVFSELSEYSSVAEYDVQTVTSNLNTLIDELHINASELAKSLNFDASYLSRIRSGKRRPSDMGAFIKGVSAFLFKKAANDDVCADICRLINSNGENLRTDIEIWLVNGKVAENESVFGFLTSLDSFNLDEYIAAIHFDDIKTPSLPFTLPTNKNFYGIEEMRKGELAFYRNAVLSKSREDLYMHSQLPITELAEDKEFFKKNMIAIAMMLKKGVHIKIIHSVDRPWNEMMLGLEGWIPLYMTGQISPYYFPEQHKGPYLNALSVAGTAAIVGEGIQGFPEDSKYYVTTNKDEVAFYRKKFENLLSKAKPLMRIFREDSRQEWLAFLDSTVETHSDMHVVCSTLPIPTISKELFYRITERNHVDGYIADRIWSDIEGSKRRCNAILRENSVTEEIPVFTRETFEEERPVFSVAQTYFQTPLHYSYDEYVQHLELTEKFARDNKNYHIIEGSKRVFKNIRICRYSDKFVIISKDNAPAIHFVIEHPRMVKAISDFDAIIRE